MALATVPTSAPPRNHDVVFTFSGTGHGEQGGHGLHGFALYTLSASQHVRAFFAVSFEMRIPLQGEVAPASRDAEETQGDTKKSMLSSIDPVQ